MKISEDHIRSIWNDDDLYTIHYDVDVAAARNELQGSRTDMNFGENFIYAEAIITAAMYSREKYKGSGTPIADRSIKLCHFESSDQAPTAAFTGSSSAMAEYSRVPISSARLIWST